MRHGTPNTTSLLLLGVDWWRIDDVIVHKEPALLIRVNTLDALLLGRDTVSLAVAPHEADPHPSDRGSHKHSGERCDHTCSDADEDRNDNSNQETVSAVEEVGAVVVTTVRAVFVVAVTLVLMAVVLMAVVLMRALVEVVVGLHELVWTAVNAYAGRQDLAMAAGLLVQGGRGGRELGFHNVAPLAKE